MRAPVGLIYLVDFFSCKKSFCYHRKYVACRKNLVDFFRSKCPSAITTQISEVVFLSHGQWLQMQLVTYIEFIFDLSLGFILFIKIMLLLIVIAVRWKFFVLNEFT